VRPVTTSDGACRPTATRIAQGVRDGELSCVEVAQAHLDRITSQNARLKAFSFVDDAAVLARAAELDRVLAQSGPLGPLHGVPVGVKDLIFTRDQPTVGGSTAYEGFTPDQDDVVVQRLRDAGALVIGKTNVPTFGFGPGTSNPLTGTTLHPDDPALSPGGSSGGSAVAVA
jgi:Asp-tRNA(Asn)/Glu-tRNA(Gln) amidotransferase A subunit family amidase